MNRPTDAPGSHDAAFALIPWLVNGRISRSEQESLERHVSGCDVCRLEVEQQRRLRQAIRRDTSNVEYAPQASLQKLLARIDASERGIENDDEQLVREAVPQPGPATDSARRRWMVAAATVMAVGIGGLLTWAIRSPSSLFPPAYQTVTTPRAHADREGAIRAVFSPTVTIDELTGIVSATGLTIVDGPSESGVYTLSVQAGSGVDVDDVVMRLRSDPRVRFAEPVVTAP
jgi:hypothetical protein